MRTQILSLILALAFAVAPPLSLAAQSGKQDLFPRPAALTSAIAFWTRVYTKIDTQSGYLHDARHLNVIYKTLRLDPYAPADAQQEAIRKAVNRYRNILLRLAKGKRTKLTSDEKQTLSIWRKGVSNRALREAAERLRFQRGQADRFRKGVIRAGAWEGFIRATLRKTGLPEDLSALPHVESSYHAGVRSHAGAVGLWQFMPATGKRFLRIDRVVDERLDPYKATEAAARLLRHNYSVLKSWPLAITAYNHGLAGMRRAVKQTGSKDIGAIVRRHKGQRFGFASRNFYAAFLAALDVSKNTERYFGELERHPPDNHPTFGCTAFMPVYALSDIFGLDEATLQALNRPLQPAVWRGEKYVPKGYALRLPADLDQAQATERLRAVALIAGFDAQNPDRYYQVRRGDSLSVVAEKYKTSVRELVAMNDLPNSHQIREGQSLRLPGVRTPKPVRLEAATPLLAAAPVNPPSGSPPTQGGETRTDNAKIPAPEAPAPLVSSNGLDQPRVDAEQDVPIPAKATDREITRRTDIEDAPSSLKTARATPSQVALEIKLPQQGPADTTLEPGEKDPRAGSLPVEPQPELSADPADYRVADDGSIEIQATETLGHYADWLDLHSTQLGQLNALREGQALVVGRRIKLDFAKVSTEGFEQRRLAHHQARQSGYFEDHRITGTREHQIVTGDNLWLLAIRDYRIPLWLLRQYNPDLDFDTVLPLGAIVLVPVVEDVGKEKQLNRLEATATFEHHRVQQTAGDGILRFANRL